MQIKEYSPVCENRYFETRKKFNNRITKEIMSILNTDNIVQHIKGRKK